MSTYDDHETSCPMCSLGLNPEALCDCDDGPLCVRCHRVYHVEHIDPDRSRWAA